MIKRIFDLLASIFALIVLSPILLVAAIGIKLSSPGPVFYRAMRSGRDGQPFTMYKFRTMHVQQETSASRITAVRDTRIFRWGGVLRNTKIDELPQLFNVVNGTMSVVGPRPEDITIVRDHYSPWMMETLAVRPGMASPGSIFGSMYDYRRNADGAAALDPESDYLHNLLPIKLAIELVYVRNASLAYDVRIVLRTIALIARVATGRRQFREQPEYQEALEILAAQQS